MQFSNFRLRAVCCPLMILGLFGSAQASEPFSASENLSEQPSKTHGSSERVRIGLELTQFEQVSVRQVSGVQDEKLIPVSKIAHTLRARLDRTNHFYVDSFHITTEPLAFDPATNNFSVRIHVAKHFGKQDVVEERIGQFVASGSLGTAKEVYVLQANSSHQFRSHSGRHRLDVRVVPVATGQTPVARGRGRPQSKKERAL